MEGRQAVRELLVAGRRRVREVLVDAGARDVGPLAEIEALAADKGIPLRRVPRARIEAEATSDAPQGVLARAEAVQPVELARLSSVARGGPAPFLVVLDGVTDPHNLGAVMRSALSAGATGLVIGRHRAVRLTPTAIKAAAGAAEYLPVALVGGVPAALAELRTAGVWVVGLDAVGPDAVGGLDAGGPGGGRSGRTAGGSGAGGGPIGGDSSSRRPGGGRPGGDGPGNRRRASTIWGLEVATEAVALVLGAEGRGLSALARQRCEVVVGIPMAGPLDSLNVSAAAAVACFEVARRRGLGGR